MVLGGLGAAALYASVTNQRTIIAVSADILRGQEVTANDLELVEVSANYQGGTPSEEIDSLVGQRALLDLPKGSFPELHHVGETPIDPGFSIVGLRLSIGRIPVSQLVPGQRVQLVGLDEANTVTDATVATLPTALDETSWAVDVVVAEDKAAQVATLAAHDEISLIVVGGSS